MKGHTAGAVGLVAPRCAEVVRTHRDGVADDNDNSCVGIATAVLRQDQRQRLHWALLRQQTLALHQPLGVCAVPS